MLKTNSIGIGRSFLTLLHIAHPQMDLSSSERYCYNLILRWNPQVEEYFIKAYGADHFSRISNALTHPSCYSCIRVNTLKSTSDAVIEKLSTIIAAGPISKCQVPGLEDYVLFVTGSGPHSINYGYTTSPPKEVIVSRKCTEAVLRGAQFCKRRLWKYGHWSANKRYPRNGYSSFELCNFKYARRDGNLIAP